MYFNFLTMGGTRLCALQALIGLTLLKAVSHTHPVTCSHGGTNDELWTAITDKYRMLNNLTRETLSRMAVNRVPLERVCFTDSYSSYNTCALCKPYTEFNRTALHPSQVRDTDVYNLGVYQHFMDIVHSYEVNSFPGSQTLETEFRTINETLRNMYVVLSTLQTHAEDDNTTIQVTQNATCGEPRLVIGNCGGSHWCDCLIWRVLRGLEELTHTIASEMSTGQWFSSACFQRSVELNTTTVSTSSSGVPDQASFTSGFLDFVRRIISGGII